MLMQCLCNAMLSLLTKPYELHVIDFLIDSQNHFGMMPADFQNWEGRVLLILSDDDHTFNQPCKYSLIEIMPNPTVVTDFRRAFSIAGQIGSVYSNCNFFC